MDIRGRNGIVGSDTYKRGHGWTLRFDNSSNWWSMANLNKLGFLGHFQNVYISH